MDIEKLATAGDVILINKPLGWTSFDVVHKVRNMLKRVAVPLSVVEGPQTKNTESGDKNLEAITPPSSDIRHRPPKPPRPPKLKVGHAGTLDPLATGLLIICTGKETKNADKYQADEKEYTGTFVIGASTPCYDLEKPVDTWYPTGHITDEMIKELTTQFLGESEQIPPIFSARRIEGQRAYDIARSGKTAVMEAKKITIKEFDITCIRREAMPDGNEEKLVKADFRVVCSKGTYIRSLAHDFGEALRSGAYLENLCRTRSGDFRLENAVTMEEFKAKIDFNRVAQSHL